MPSVSGKQHLLMEAVAHDPGFAKKVGIKQSVGEDFSQADKGKHFAGPKHPKSHAEFHALGHPKDGKY